MKHKKIIISAIIIVILGLISFFTYRYFTKEDKKTTLTIVEKKWIEENKNKVIDLSIINSIPVLNYGGEGIFFDFISSLEEDTGLEFNKVSYNLGDDIKTKYAFKIVDKVGENDILVYQDNYVILTKENKKYNSISEIKNLTIGVLNEDLNSVNTYLLGSTNVAFKTFSNYDELMNSFNGTDTENPVNAIVLPKTIYLKEIVSNNNLNLAYNITEYTKDFVLQLGDTEKLNDILRKYYKKWYLENYEESYNTHLTNNYFTFKEFDEKEKVKFRSKRYVYGFVDNAPYDTLVDNKLNGINNSFMADFARLADIEISYNKYNSIEALTTAFNENKIDFFLNNNSSIDYSLDTVNTVSPFDEQVVIISDLSNNILVNSVNSLKDKEITVVKDTKVAEYLAKFNCSFKLYDNVESLINGINKNSIVALDLDTYNYYVRTSLNDYKIDYQFTLDSDYSYIVRDISENTLFSNYFSFYLSFIPEQLFINDGYNTLLNINPTPMILKNGLLTLALLAIVTVILLLIIKFNPKTKKKKSMFLSKEDKLKYIDMLTSLKNRNYLNDHIEEWDNSEIYPQTIIIIDLNNVAYINDNYGHAEGDNVIRSAANILIKNQLPNTDIIRTNGNEFLIYLVSYDEKQVVSYMRKLNKEFKDLAHGFGAAMGYSIINDAIKTIDDAVNEATLDMRNNKEELNN